MKKIASIVVTLGILATPIVAFAKKAEPPTALALQQMQTREIEGTKDQVFGAVMSVLQDSGYRIQSADKDTGLITGLSSTKSHMVYSLWSGFGKSKKSPIVSAFIEQRTPTIVSVRITFVMAKVKSSIYGSQPQDEEPIYDPQIYQSAFEQINQAMFVRRSMAAGTTAPTATTMPAAAPTAATPVATTPTPNNQ